MPDADVKSFFEVHAHDYLMTPEFYSSIVRKISPEIPAKTNLKLLDVGCGSGNFIKSLNESGMRADFIATDLSFQMINIAKKNLQSRDVDLVVADAFNMPLKRDIRFDIIHIAFLLHHLIAKTRAKSMALIVRLISLLIDKLANNGVLLIEEVYYNSYIIPCFTAAFIFYMLKLLRVFRMDLSGISTKLKTGLEVNFLNEKLVEDTLSKFGTLRLIDKNPWKVPKPYAAFLLRDFGNITYMIKK
jgi:SAM-dependent methyltransferase